VPALVVRLTSWITLCSGRAVQCQGW
jgi:hypothetical protein